MTMTEEGTLEYYWDIVGRGQSIKLGDTDEFDAGAATAREKRKINKAVKRLEVVYGGVGNTMSEIIRMHCKIARGIRLDALRRRKG